MVAAALPSPLYRLPPHVSGPSQAASTCNVWRKGFVSLFCVRGVSREQYAFFVCVHDETYLVDSLLMFWLVCGINGWQRRERVTCETTYLLPRAMYRVKYGMVCLAWFGKESCVCFVPASCGLI